MKIPRALTYLFVFLLIWTACSTEQSPVIYHREKTVSPHLYDMNYEVGNWEHPNYSKPFESFGNHRVVIETREELKVVQVKVPWRRRDDNPEKKAVIVVDASTNQPVQNQYVLSNTNAAGHIIFQPNAQSNKYFIYYYPHESTGSYYPKLMYIEAGNYSSKAWFEELELSNSQLEAIPQAQTIKAESIDEFHSFFPMEIISTDEEVSAFIGKNPKPFYLFPEYRDHPIKMQDYLPLHWVKQPQLINGLKDQVKRGEYYTFQIGVYGPNQNLEDIQIEKFDLKGSSGTISIAQMTCFNSGGIDLNGIPFINEVAVPARKVQALWFGIQIPENAKTGNYLGYVTVQPNGLLADTVYVELDISSDSIGQDSDESPEKMSRLRWLNSTIGSDPATIIKPFEPVLISEKTMHILGRDIKLNQLGFPTKISSYFTQEMTKLKETPEDILAHPISFEVISKDGSIVQWESAPFLINQEHTSGATWKTMNSSTSFNMNVEGALEYDGMLDYKISLVAKERSQVSDIRLIIPMDADAAKYILGLGLKGSKRPDTMNWKWDISQHQEGAWLGAVNKGLQYVLRDKNYVRPLNTNFYQNQPLNLPTSWYNEGRGGITISSEDHIVSIENYSGPRELIKGDTIHFHIRFLITPFKLLDTKTHFETRFVHKYVPVDSVVKWNGTVVNVHHANKINPYINYPFYNLKQQKAYILEAHSKGVQVKLYNTIRELSYKAHELFAFKSLGDEILNDGEGGGHSWLQEHFKSNYHSAWHATRVNDAAILNKGNSRWTNYYIEGINWLAKNQEIDGLYLDDLAFSRNTVKRIASVFNTHRESFVIDLHSANQYNNRDGYTNSALLYMEHFPYVSRLWFGEYFEYDLGPDYWMTEVSGIPFGLTGEMLEKGGHPYRGMVYGMTTRIYGNYSPEALWKLFNEFDISNSEMLGYWVDRSPVKTAQKNIKSSIFLHSKKALIAIGSWSDIDEIVTLNINWKYLGIDKNKAILTSPHIEGLQDFKQYKLDQPVLVKKDRGLILLLEEQKI